HRAKSGSPVTTKTKWHLSKLVQGGGFEPPKLARQIYSLIPLATREPLPKNRRHFLARPHSCQLIFLINSRSYTTIPNEKWSWREELNPRPADYKSAALPTEL